MNNEPLIELYRFGLDEHKTTYNAITVLMWPFEDVVVIKGLDAKITTGQAKELKRFLKGRGASTAMYQRHGKIKLRKV